MQICTIRMEFEFEPGTPPSTARRIVKRACQNPRYIQVLGRPRIVLMTRTPGGCVICVALVAKVRNCEDRSNGLLAETREKISDAGLVLVDSRLNFLLLAA